MTKIQKVYIISGPLGVGKSSVAKKISEKLKNSIYIEGDIYLHSLNNIENIEWERKLKISWENIVSVTKNYLAEGFDLVIDFVVEDELEWIVKNLSEQFAIEIIYAVLVANSIDLEKRLEKKNGLKYLERSLKLLKKLNGKKYSEFHINTSKKSIDEIASEIIRSPNKTFPI